MNDNIRLIALQAAYLVTRSPETLGRMYTTMKRFALRMARGIVTGDRDRAEIAAHDACSYIVSRLMTDPDFSVRSFPALLHRQIRCELRTTQPQSMPWVEETPDTDRPVSRDHWTANVYRRARSTMRRTVQTLTPDQQSRLMILVHESITDDGPAVIPNVDPDLEPAYLSLMDTLVRSHRRSKSQPRRPI